MAQILPKPFFTKPPSPNPPSEPSSPSPPHPTRGVRWGGVGPTGPGWPSGGLRRGGLPYVSEIEIDKVNNFLRNQAEPDYVDEILNFADEKEIGEKNKDNSGIARGSRRRGPRWRSHRSERSLRCARFGNA